MDFEGHSILELQSSDPSVLAAIVVLQAEVEAAVTDINTLRQRVDDDEKTVTGLTLAVNTTKADVKTLEQDVSRIQQDITAMAAQIRVLQNAPNIADCGSLVLTCPIPRHSGSL